MSRDWREATDFEFSHRALLLAAVFFLSFQLYAFDRVPAADALAAALRHAGLSGCPPRLVRAAGALVVLLAALLRTWAAAYMSSGVVQDRRVIDTRLVADGPYRYVRNPLYLGILLLGLGLAPAASRTGAVVLPVLLQIFQLRLVRREERALLATQGAPYRAYLERVPRFLPAWRPRLPAGGRRPRWGQAIAGESFMWGFVLIAALYAATGRTRFLARGSLGLIVLILLLRGRRFRMERAST